MRFAIGLILGATLATPIAGAVALGARAGASREIQARHDSLDAEYRTVCARAAVAGVAWMELATTKATALTGDRVWTTTVIEGE